MTEDLGETSNDAAQIEEALELSETKVDELTKDLESAKQELNHWKEKRDTLSFELLEKETVHEAETAKMKGELQSVMNALSLEAADADVLAEIERLQSEKAKNAELLEEMNAMNAELKKRGERLSELEDESRELKSKTIPDMTEKLESQESRIKMQHTKIQSLQLKLESEAAAAPADALSTSTVSKAEEESRMQDVEASFEERYVKLKLVAVKLKKKTAEQEKRQVEQAAKNGQGRQELKRPASRVRRGAGHHRGPEGPDKDVGARRFSISERLHPSQGKDWRADVESVGLEAASASLAQAQKELEALTGVSREKQALEEQVSAMKAKLERLTGAEKKQDLLDMELEEAEAKVKALTENQDALEKELRETRVCRDREKEAKENKAGQVAELESLLKTETVRVSRV